MSWSDLTTGDAPYGYVNRFNMTSEWAFGRLVYVPLSDATDSLKTLRIASGRHFEGCWPVCLKPRACARRGACYADERRTWAIAVARFALGRYV